MSLIHLSGRSRSAIIAWLVAALGVPLGALAPAEANNVRVNHALFGVHDSSLVAHSHIDNGAVRLWDVGVQWRDVETSPGTYDFSRLDAIVSAAQAAHENVTMVVAMTPSFYAARPTDPPARIQHYKAFVSALMHRYRNFHGKRGIAAYQVWNEANIGTFWTGSTQQLARLSLAMRDVRNRVDPKATIVGPPMVTRLPYEMDRIKAYYGAKLNGTPVWKFYDALAFSLYPVATIHGRPAGPEDSMTLLHQVRANLRKDHVPGRLPIWNTEINYGLKSGGGGVASRISDAKQASYVARTYLLNAAAGVKRVFWYRYDMGAVSTGGTLANTLLSKPGHPSTVTAAGKAFALVQKWMHGTLEGSGSKAPCAKNSQGTYTCVVKDSTGIRRIYWNPYHQATVRLASNARHVQGVLGAVSRVRGGSVLTVGFRPVMVGR